MPVTVLVALGQTFEDPLDPNGQVTWPASTTLSGQPGDLIVKNRGPSLTYTGADGQVIQFGAYLSGTTVTGTATGAGVGNQRTYDGPYACIAPNAFDLRDPNYHQVEPFADIAYYQDPTTKAYPVYLWSGDNQIYGQNIVPESVGLNQLHISHPVQGAFVGATMRVDASNRMGWGASTQHAVFELQTTDAGDLGTILSGSGGGYFIGATANVLLAANDWAYAVNSFSFIGNGPAFFAQWPNAGSPARCNIAFCHLHAGSSTAGSIIGSGGALSNAHGYSWRYSYTKNLLTLNCLLNQSAVTGNNTQGQTSVQLASVTNLQPGMILKLSGGAPNTDEYLTVSGSYTPGNLTVPLIAPQMYNGHQAAQWGSFGQAIETMLSTPLDVPQASVPAGGAASMTFTIPPIPLGYDNFIIYGAADVSTNGPQWLSQTLGSDYTSTQVATGYQITVTHLNSTGSGKVPSHGFSAWPPGTLLKHDSWASYFNLMKVANISASADKNTLCYDLKGYHENTMQGNTTGLAPLAVTPEHANLVTAPSAGPGKVVIVSPTDTSKFDLGPVASALMSNPMTTDQSPTR